VYLNTPRSELERIFRIYNSRPDIGSAADRRVYHHAKNVEYYRPDKIWHFTIRDKMYSANNIFLENWWDKKEEDSIRADAPVANVGTRFVTPKYVAPVSLTGDENFGHISFMCFFAYDDEHYIHIAAYLSEAEFVEICAKAKLVF
jgi:hypothetical protein